MIKILITSIVSKNCRAYTISLSSKEKLKIDDILEYQGSQYKVTSVHKDFGFDAFKILSKSVSKSKYIHIDKDMIMLTEKTKKTKR